MKLVPFVADSPAAAVAQIRAALGPEAVVVNVRQLRGEGLGRFFQKPRLEVLAYRPEQGADLVAGSAPIPPLDFREGVERAGHSGHTFTSVPARRALQRFALDASPENSGKADGAGWRLASILESSGFLPLPAQQVLERVQTCHGPVPPSSVAEELNLARTVLTQLWRKPQPFVDDSLRPHVLIGALAAGKTTALCKWLAQTVLMDGREARVWRLDGQVANNAEALSIYCEILGVAEERAWEVTVPGCGAVSFIDIPGVDWRQPQAIRDLRLQLKNYLAPQVHLVLNAAYDMPVLLAQIRAFASLPIEDLILTHLDEERRWGKIWNLVLGTKYTVRFLSAGQNIPGDFSTASPEKIFARQFSA